MCHKQGARQAICYYSTKIAIIIVAIVLATGCKKSNQPGFNDSLGEVPSPLQVIQTTPDDDATNIDLDISIQATFNTSIDSTTINNNTFIVRQDTTPVSGSFFFRDSSVTFAPTNEFQRNMLISTIITSEVADVNGNIMEQDFKWSFTTRQATTDEIIPPAVTSTEPSPGAREISADINIYAHFNKALNPSTVNNNTFLLRTNNTSISGSVSYKDSIATFNPSKRLPDGAEFTATITENIEDPFGNALDNNHSWSFTTEEVDRTPPSVESTTPQDGQQDVPVDIQLTATFSEQLDPATVTTNTFRLQSSNGPISGSVSYSGTTATFTPDNSLADGTDFTATITNGIEDLNGNSPNNYNWSFTTKEIDRTPPHVISTKPQDGQQNVPAGIQLSATFSEQLDPSSVNNNTFRLQSSNGNISGSVNYSGTTATFIPDNPLADGTTFTATITNGIEDFNGNALDNNYSWNFTTEVIDQTPPSVESTNPQDGQQDVPVDIQLTATFSEQLDPATVTTNTFRLQSSNGPISGSVSYSGTTATYTPDNPLADGTTFTATITNGIEDLNGNALDNNYSWNFTTEVIDQTPPSVESTNPQDGQQDVPVDIQLTATFSEQLDPATVTTNTFRLQSSNGPISGAVSYSGTTATFTPDNPLADGTSFTATITNGIEDFNGNALDNNYSWSFTTEVVDQTPPSVESTNPQDGQQDVPVNIQLSATFSEQLDPSSVNNNTFRLQSSNGTISGSVSYSGTTATFTPDNPLPDGTDFTATITNGIRDLNGNALDNNYSWSFTTEVIDQTPPSVESTNPQDGQQDVPVDIQLSATFSEQLDPSSVNNNTFRLQSSNGNISGSVNYSGTTATFIPDNSLADGTDFTATITNGVTDLNGNALGNNYSWNFTTEVVDQTPPTVESTTPQDGQQDVRVDIQLTASFSEQLDPATVTTNTFRLQSSNGPISGSVNYSGTTATFIPDNPLADGTDFTATITNGIEDLNGNALDNNYSWNFTTEDEEEDD
ncbi:Ig-like domain-containing protein [Fodinibius sp. Rm-B-1B1-1]|uniref:Ig-like domain-containing protein n=1 Tax=Fodinibius alkaliphilus TaxID=3140241 RepID=UPI00315A5C3B